VNEWKKARNVEESGEASRRDDVCRDGRRVAWRARIAGRRRVGGMSAESR